MRSQRTRTHTTPTSCPPAAPQRGPAGSGNAARADDCGLSAAGPAPQHELGGPLAGLVLDALPIEQACADAMAWLDNPAVAAWWRDHAPTGLTLPGVAASAVDAIWPRGLRLTVEGDLGGRLTGGLETEASSQIGRDADGRTSAQVRTRAGVTLTQAVGTREEDAFGQTEAARRLEAGGRLTLDVLWDADGVLLGGPRLAAALLAGATPEALGEQAAQAALEAAPDVAVEAGVHARADVTVDALETHGLRTPLRTLAAPLLAACTADGSALISQASRIELLGPGMLEARLTLSGALDVDARAVLAAVPALVAPEQWEALEAQLQAGAECTLVARMGAAGTPRDAWLTLGVCSGDAEGGRQDRVTVRSTDELEAALGSGNAPVAWERTVSRPLSADEAEALLPLATRALAGTLGLVGHAPGVQSLEALHLEATATVPAAAIVAARAAGLRGQTPRDEVDTILAAATAGPLPAGADAAGAAAGAQALPAPPSLRLRGRVLLGVGGALATGAVEDASATARGRAGLDLDHPVPAADAPDLLAALA